MGPAKFSPQAADEFRQTIFELFGQTSERHPILYCYRKTDNNKPVYVGTGRAIRVFLTQNPEVVRQLDIAEVTVDGFVARCTDGAGKVGFKYFDLDTDTTIALYTMQGWQTMACIKPLGQFESEAVLHVRASQFPRQARVLM